MSRTFKDRPERVNAKDPKNKTHIQHCHVTRVDGKWRNPLENVECDYGKWDQRKHPTSSKGRCHDKLEHWESHSWWTAYFTPPVEDCHTGWHNRERVRERNDLTQAAKEYNTQREIDDYDFPNYQHRHASTWWA